jgi:histone H3/H4
LARELLVVESKVRQLLPEGIRLSSDALEGLNELVKQAVKKAIERCQANGRKTIIKEDF